ncbi:NAD-dependent protein deacylase, partial [Vibrio sp. 10N.261.45.A4]
AAGFVHDAKMHGAHTIEINLEPSAVQSEFEEKRYGPAGVEVPKLVEELLS